MITVVEELGSGRYYARWLEANAEDSRRLACNCGYRSMWRESQAQLRAAADELHGAH